MSGLANHRGHHPGHTPDNVRPLSDLHARTELAQKLTEHGEQHGPAGNLHKFLIRLLEDPTVDVRIADSTVVVPKNDIKLRSIVHHCDINSEGTASKWRQHWIENGWLTGQTISVDLDGPPTPVPNNIAPPSNEEAGESTHLSLLLGELRRAHHEQLADYIDQLNTWIAHELGQETFPTSRETQPEAAETCRETATPSRELVSSFIDKSTLTNFPSTAEAPRNRDPSKERTKDELFDLLEPLTTLIRQRNLTEMGNRFPVEAQLRSYSDAQVTAAIKTIARMIRRGEHVTSPIGLLCHLAKQGNPEFFTDDQVPAAPAAAFDTVPSPAAEPVNRADAMAHIESMRKRTTNND